MDRRIAGVTRDAARLNEGDLMRVPDEILKCTAFMAYRKDERFVLVGTAFFVGVPVVDVTMLPRFPYLVTAKHVIEHIESYSDDYYAYVRVNVCGPENEGVGWLRTEVENWYFHPEEDSAVDVAVYQFWDSRLYGTPSNPLPKEISFTDGMLESETRYSLLGCSDFILARQGTSPSCVLATLQPCLRRQWRRITV